MFDGCDSSGASERVARERPRQLAGKSDLYGKSGKNNSKTFGHQSQRVIASSRFISRVYL